jgi:hypothetical protein
MQDVLGLCEVGLVLCWINMHHYVRKYYLKCVRTKNEDMRETKNGDAQITCLHRHVLYYRVVRDTRSGTSPISIY